jgi:hypothetical protein
VKAFLIYTGARVLLFAATFGLIWLIFGRWFTWDAPSALYTALIALIVSSVIALFALRTLRDSLATDVSRRADRMRTAFDARRSAEDEASAPGRNPADAGQGRPPADDGETRSAREGD